MLGCSGDGLAAIALDRGMNLAMGKSEAKLARPDRLDLMEAKQNLVCES
jgi:hypothetical protein